jgi:hypothetical protein
VCLMGADLINQLNRLHKSSFQAHRKTLEGPFQYSKTSFKQLCPEQADIFCLIMCGMTR